MEDWRMDETFANEVGILYAAIAEVLEDRGLTDVRDRIRTWHLTHAEEHYYGTLLGPAVDELAHELGYETAYPEDGDE